MTGKKVLIENIKKKHNEEEVKKILSDIVRHLVISNFGYIKTLGAEEIYKHLIEEGIDLSELEILDSEKDYEEFFDKFLNDKAESVNIKGLESQIDFIILNGISADNIEMMLKI